MADITTIKFGLFPANKKVKSETHFRIGEAAEHLCMTIYQMRNLDKKGHVKAERCPYTKERWYEKSKIEELKKRGVITITKRKAHVFPEIPDNVNYSDLINIEKTAEILNISIPTVRNWALQGKFTIYVSPFKYQLLFILKEINDYSLTL